MDEKKELVFSTKDPFDNNVVLKEDTWKYKILNYTNTDVNCHKEMEEHVGKIESTISHPMFIQQDTTEDAEGNLIFNSRRAEYYKLFFDNNGIKALKAVVEYDHDIEDFKISDSNGEIVTAHFYENNKIKSIKGANLYDSSEK